MLFLYSFIVELNPSFENISNACKFFLGGMAVVDFLYHFWVFLKVSLTLSLEVKSGLLSLVHLVETFIPLDDETLLGKDVEVELLTVFGGQSVAETLQLSWLYPDFVHPHGDGILLWGRGRLKDVLSWFLNFS